MSGYDHSEALINRRASGYGNGLGGLRNADFQLGYDLLRGGRMDDAVAIFMLNVNSFPKSWNVNDSLGEAQAAKGEKAAAIKNYARSVELNPENISGIGKLHDLATK